VNNIYKCLGGKVFVTDSIVINNPQVYKLGLYSGSMPRNATEAEIRTYLREVQREVEDGTMTPAQFRAMEQRLLAQFAKQNGAFSQKTETLNILVADLADSAQLGAVRTLGTLFFRTVYGRDPDDDELDIYTDTNVLMALLNRKPAGAIWLTENAHEDLPNSLYINAIYVKEQFEGRGIGSHLVYQAIDRNLGIDRIYLHPTEGAERFYQENGFLTYDALRDGDSVTEMCLPFTRRAFREYRDVIERDTTDRTKAQSRGKKRKIENKVEVHRLFEGMRDCFSEPEWDRYITAVSPRKDWDNPGPEFDQEPIRNPFTLPLCKKLRINHLLADSNHLNQPYQK